MKISKYILLTFLCGFIAVGCTDDFEEINSDPHAYNDLDPGIQLAKVQLDLSGKREEVWRYDLGICSPMVQHLGGSWWTQHGGQYRIVEKEHWYSLWENTYPRDLKNIQNLIDRTLDDPENINIHSAARILRVYIYSRLTDLYGDIPYSQAIKGFTDGILLPRYDNQQEIYIDFFKELAEANNAFDNNRSDVSGDLFFEGNVDKWRKFGNSLRLRLGFRLLKVDPTEAQKQVEAAIAGGVMESNEDICMMRHSAISFLADENRGNGRSQVFHASPNSEGFRLTRTFVDHMTNTGDPRLRIYGGTYLADGTDISEHLMIGITPGAMWWNEWSDFGDLFDAENNYVAYVPHGVKHVQPSRYVSALDAPFFHMTYAEVELLMAEAAVRGWGTANVEAHYQSALDAALKHVSHYPGSPTLSQTTIDDFIAANPLPPDDEGKIRVINEQMWVNFFLNGAEAYSNWRRTGYPELAPFTSVEWYSSGTGGIVPRRFFYPEFEAQNNPENYTDAVGRLGGTDDWLKRVWWDVE
ncbi:SusD/RagB family nutrient-binding outer membrane lipoprotein [Fulvivirgaceae bacterium BMA10]|uniref:SusD/RagB family nutrient-binding outer membrane lipoprotein n=1 Tax=Splendidivirga corallicola TaxID=3051826 RepID=A0ABT8KJ32_9BACT|nr:SusD/RagB family nutrient-binding outer membrane lipoprotein [Fulvivirgaceae bacterium BMA10]